MKSRYLSILAKEPLYRRVIRWVYCTYLDELYIPFGSEISLTYHALGKRGIKIRYQKSGPWRGTQEEYFDIPEDKLSTPIL